MALDKKTLEFFKQKGAEGGKKTKEKYGVEHYRKRAEHMNAVRKLKKLAEQTKKEIKSK